MHPHIARIMRLLVATTFCLSTATAWASASTWHSNVGMGGYSGAFTATAGPVTFTGSTAALSCTSATEAATVTGSSYAGNPWTGAITGSGTFNGCTVGGQAAQKVCTHTFDFSTWGAISYALSGGALSSGTLHLRCSVRRLGVEVCVITGNVPVRYYNPTSTTPLSADGYFSVPAVSKASGLLQAANGSGGNCPIGTGSVGMSAVTFSETSTPQPVFWGSI
jgi:hypothetical protein